MSEPVTVYKPTDEEILENVLASFRIEDIVIPYDVAKEIFSQVLVKNEKGKK
jgi:hypothetical protein